ncbi:MAG TPA: hypothetical protein VLA91_04785 [Acidimicrobiia bacterium]|nr:hypothetical protein [Acidimicrobiia bacterium]
MSVIEVEDLVKSYDQIPIVDGISFRAAADPVAWDSGTSARDTLKPPS